MDMVLAVDKLKQCYCGFFLSDPCGNNIFSFQERQCREIYIPSLISGSLDNVKVGTKTVFSEMVDGVEKNSSGLENFVHWQNEGKDIFIFDNHNHAFAFWSFGVKVGAIPVGCNLMHVDQHKDTRQPNEYLENRFWENKSFAQISNYVNNVLNVGDFIDPALRSGMLGKLIMVDHEQAFEQRIEQPFVLDVDLDVFSSDMGYISKEKKILFIRDVINQSCFVTIATSPHFMDQKSAISILHDLFD